MVSVATEGRESGLMASIEWEAPLAALAASIERAFPDDEYTCSHATRYAFTLQLLRPHVRADMRVLDVGYTRFTQLLHAMSGATVDSISNWPEADHPEGHHYSFDLNDAVHPDRHRADLPEYDLIVFSEVIEHLHISPFDSVGYLRTRIKPGGMLLIQTPNAVSWTKRLKILAGRHPYQMIEPGNTGDCHIREYTLPELRAVLSANGLQIVREGLHTYFDQRVLRNASPARKAKSMLVRTVNRLAPPGLRPAITILARLPL
jgi:2-polyprenyl-3-methyl-5-hydroxy-6-metoxy-1,4-benzoquinol methylase